MVTKEILGHLIDSANVNLNRFLSGNFIKMIWFLDTYPQNEWVEIQNYNKRDWGELIVLWSSLNLHIANINQSNSKRNSQSNQQKIIILIKFAGKWFLKMKKLL